MDNLRHNQSFISTKDIEGTRVYGPDGKEISVIDHLMIDRVSGKIVYAVIKLGGVVVIAAGYYPVPWSLFSFEAGLDGFRAKLNENQLREGPQLSESSWNDREWERTVHDYYAVQPYWDR